MKYLDKVLGIEVTYENVEFKHLPNFIAARYCLQMVAMNGQRAIFLYPKTELEQIEVLKKHIARIQKNENLPVVLVLDELSFRQKEYLIREKIPFTSIGADASAAFHLWRRTGIVNKSSCERLGTDTYFYIEGIETA